MPTQKIILFGAALILIAAVVIGVGFLSPEKDTPVDYALTSIQDGTFTGVLPPLDREIQVSENTREEVRAALRSKVAEDQAILTQRPYDGNVWMDLALRYHSGGDYAGAQEIWEFIVAVSPENLTALGNLGRLHHFELKNFEIAEQYFKKALEINPARADVYYELFDLYRYSYKKDTTAAIDIMKAGTLAFPDDYGFPAGIGVYYRDRGQSGLARTYFEKALAVARARDDLAGVETLTHELESLQ